MCLFSFENKIKRIKSSIVAIGFLPDLNQHPNRITIIGSGFSITNDGKLLSCNHLFDRLNQEQIANLRAIVMIEQGPNELERYERFPISIIDRDDRFDLAILQVSDYQRTLLKPLKLGNSDRVSVGNSVYFIGFPYAARLMNEGFGITLIVSRGIIGNIKRDGTDPARRRSWIIIDTISNPGNSGSPLLDEKSNKIIGVISISFSKRSQRYRELDIKEPMHICAAKPINLAQNLLHP